MQRPSRWPRSAAIARRTYTGVSNRVISMATTRKTSGSGLLGALKKVVKKGSEQAARSLTKTRPAATPTQTEKPAAAVSTTPTTTETPPKATKINTKTRAQTPATPVTPARAAPKPAAAKAPSMAKKASSRVSDAGKSAKASTQKAAKQVSAAAKKTGTALSKQAAPHIDGARTKAMKAGSAVQTAVKTPLFNGHTKAREMADSARIRVGTAMQAIRPNLESRAFMATSRGKRLAKEQARADAAAQGQTKSDDTR